jgi:dihydrodipicolinate synthase/N-acetylneuraminate lyase
VREDPSHDAYLDAILKELPREVVVSGIGERPAIVHLRDFHLTSFTTGSGCIAPHLSMALLDALKAQALRRREKLRANSCRSRTRATRSAPSACCTTR